MAPQDDLEFNDNPPGSIFQVVGSGSEAPLGSNVSLLPPEEEPCPPYSHCGGGHLGTDLKPCEHLQFPPQRVIYETNTSVIFDPSEPQERAKGY